MLDIKNANIPVEKEFYGSTLGVSQDEEFRILVSCIKEYAIFLTDSEGVISTWNEGAKNIKGYEAHEIIGQHVSIFYTTEDIEKDQVALNHKKTRELGSYEDKGWRLRKDGSAFWASVLTTACYNEQHHLKGFITVTKDISDQKIIEDNLSKLVLEQSELVHASYEKVVFHLENSPLGFIEWDDQLHIRSMSKRAEEIFGWSLAEFIEKEKNGITQVFEEDQERLREISNQLLSGKIESNKIQNRNYTKDGRVIWCDWFNSALKDKDGKVVTLMSMVQDITERKENEEKLRQLEKEQIDIQREVTKAVINAQEKERAEIGEELHDNVNQLLAASNLFFHHSLTQPDYVTYILKGQEYITTAMEEIRKLSHVLVGPNQAESMGLIDSLDELVKNIVSVKSIKIEFNHSAYPEGDEVGLKLVIFRIVQEQLSNILKHAEATEVQIIISQVENILTVEIIDNGKGFNSAEKSNGIGLKNIRNRAGIYNGTVEIITAPGAGCKIKIIFTIISK